MGLFVKKPLANELVMPYTLSLDTTNTLLIVGLGNPDAKYTKTRHNIGFMVIDHYANTQNAPAFSADAKLQAQITTASKGSSKLILAKPSTYMNNSGQSVQAIAHFYKIPLENIVIVHDELSIPFGQIRMRVGGQDAGHNGIKSVIQHCGPDFGRIRIGIQNKFVPKDDTSKFVLSPFSKQEQAHLPTLITEASLVIDELAYSGKISHETRSIILE